MPTTVDASKVDNSYEDGIPLTTIEITGNSTTKDKRHDCALNYMQRQPPDHVENIENQTQFPDGGQINQTVNLNPSASSDIYVHTDIQIRVGNAGEVGGAKPVSNDE
ncbi:hypothetical protein F4813DRAFT_396323 [Daldinia decipiens]|uniref:uncharacterized protein n=1 Tax=Daldinia decipiens TaxID=326647 RepID=UPI0020C532EC|nr:uncharacterized protein F4813DRAFT_396323 [Daldinia decipiens]KAI1657413.1 hypothetical protein F4813DRAFT_396323 [Daldinia decipiens]